MKAVCLTTMITVLLFCTDGIQAQTTQKEFPKARSEYNVLDAGQESGTPREKHETVYLHPGIM